MDTEGSGVGSPLLRETEAHAAPSDPCLKMLQVS